MKVKERVFPGKRVSFPDGGLVITRYLSATINDDANDRKPPQRTGITKKNAVKFIARCALERS
jgi:hypothetical protein